MEAPPNRKRISLVMSIPRVGWNDHWGCHFKALGQFAIHEQIFGYGAWWDHTISNAFEQAIDGGADWIITLDYDTLMRSEDVMKLLQRFAANPHIDALAALQPRRGEHATPIMSRIGESEVYFDADPIQADTAHFGFTIFRAAKLAAMPKPWFLHRPDPNGSYKTTARLDPDIYFWHKWREAGNTLYVDPHIRVGHLQAMVAVFEDNDGVLAVRHVHVDDWRNGKDGADVTHDDSRESAAVAA